MLENYVAMKENEVRLHIALWWHLETILSKLSQKDKEEQIACEFICINFYNKII